MADHLERAGDLLSLAGVAETMTENGKIQQLLDRLTEKTRRKELTWSESFPPGSFMISFPSHSVKIGLKDPGPGLVLSMYDEYGRVFEETAATSAGMTSEGSPLLGKKLLELLQAVQTSTEKEGELDKLLQELG